MWSSSSASPFFVAVLVATTKTNFNVTQRQAQRGLELRPRNKEACLPVSSCLLVAVWYVFGKNWLFRYLLLFLRGVLSDAVIRGVGYDQAELKALNVSLWLGDIVAPTPSACSAGVHARFVSHGTGTRMTASRPGSG